MPGLRETLEAATPEWIAGSRYPECLSFWNGQHGKHVRMPSAADAQLAALAPELAAWGLDVFERHTHLLDDDLLNRWQEITGGRVMTAPASSPVDDALDRLASRTWVDYGGREADLATVRSALEQLREERDSERERFARHVETMIEPKLLARVRAAEAEVQRYREGLREIEGILKRKRDREGTGPYRALTVARETLEGDPERHVRALLSASPTGGGGTK